MKDAVYSWRLSTELKTRLEQVAHQQHESLASLLERIAREWLAESAEAGGEEEQVRLHASALPFLGAFDGGDPERSAKARETLRARLADRHRRTG
jgi:hypothetical protein